MEDEYEETAERMEGIALRGKGRGGRDRRGGRGGGGGGRPQDREMLISKALSSLLRHQATSAGIKLDAEGFAPLDRVMQWPRLRSLNPSFDEIRAAVADNAKQRFAMKPEDSSSSSSSTTADVQSDPAAWLIRANQGHSIALADEGLHTPITIEAGNIPETVVHGTYFAFWPAIVAAGGLKKMGRRHVHFGTRLLDQDRDPEQEGKEKVVSGMRSDAEVLVFVDVERSLRDGGIKWWISANDVVLTDGDGEGVVPLKYFKEVRGRKQGVGLLWKDGEKVADLPEGIVAKVPMGKGRGGAGGGGRGGGGRGGRGGRRGGRGRGQES
ncbi:RNA 2'-phosphotransferase, Tpt1 [Annulohypoxylon moriforme]|nr:RNA 2'-phosphotransferase, Tpt1 [Annulohypoxylon moriforme]